jgi:hypothetical protein
VAGGDGDSGRALPGAHRRTRLRSNALEQLTGESRRAPRQGRYNKYLQHSFVESAEMKNVFVCRLIRFSERGDYSRRFIGTKETTMKHTAAEILAGVLILGGAAAVRADSPFNPKGAMRDNLNALHITGTPAIREPVSRRGR